MQYVTSIIYKIYVHHWSKSVGNYYQKTKMHSLDSLSILNLKHNEL